MPIHGASNENTYFLELGYILNNLPVLKVFMVSLKSHRLAVCLGFRISICIIPMIPLTNTISVCPCGAHN